MHRDICTWFCAIGSIVWLVCGIGSIGPNIGLFFFFCSGYLLARAIHYWQLGEWKEGDD